MFEDLQCFPRILVTGPQRSGTRICARMVAKDVGHRYLDEREYAISEAGELSKKLESSREKTVIHGPAIMAMAPKILRAGDLLIYMDRDYNDIKASRARINWNDGQREINRLYTFHPYLMAHAMDGATDITLKQALYARYNITGPFSTMRVYYGDLQDHPLWLEEGKRKNFTWYQTEVEV